MYPFLVLVFSFCGTALAGSTIDNPVDIEPTGVNLTSLRIRDNFYGERDVAYWVNPDGYAIIDGDVIYGTEDDLLKHRADRVGARDLEGRAFTSSNTWPGAVVTFNYDSAASEIAVGAIVNSAIASWTSLAPYLGFNKIANSATGQNGVLTIRSTACGGCAAGTIGYNAANPLAMNLQQACTGSGPPGACGINEAVHEFGHVLGFLHEHQRPDRDTFVSYQCQNVRPQCATMPAGQTCCAGPSSLPAGCCATVSNFAIIKGPGVDYSGPYDLTSLMQYRATAFAIAGTNTLVPARAGLVVPAANPPNPDATDVERLCKIYRDRCPRAQACKAMGCPTDCKLFPTCQNSPRCSDRTVPRCCDAVVDNAECKLQRNDCKKANCNFL
jgi:Astacin (Peptidase family M12A)